MGCAVLRGLAAVRHLYGIAHKGIKSAVAQMLCAISMSCVVQQSQIREPFCTIVNK